MIRDRQRGRINAGRAGGRSRWPGLRPQPSGPSRCDASVL